MVIQEKSDKRCIVEWHSFCFVFFATVVISWMAQVCAHKKKILLKEMNGMQYTFNILGPVVQSIVSLTKSLNNDSLSLFVHLKSSVLIFFAEKMWGGAMQKLLTFFR